MPSDPTSHDIALIVPFRGGPAEAERLLGDLRAIDRGPRDELIIVDNSPRAVLTAQPEITIVRADELACSYYARNRGARAARADWLAFTDADCRPASSLLSAFRAVLAEAQTGLVAGEIESAPEQRSLIARWHRSRGHLDAAAQLELGPYPTAGTANLMVSRELWLELDGFREVVSGADFEFCWRAGRAGWRLSFAPAARVEHIHPEELATVFGNARRYGAGQRWADVQFPGASPPPPILRQIGRAIAGTLVWTLTLRFERAAFKAIDGVALLGFAWGYRFGSNRARPLA